MATILRDWSYRYQSLYDSISWVAALSVGGIQRFRELPLQGLPIAPETRVLDVCCGCGQATQVLVARSQRVVGLDASPRSLARARANVPAATYVQGFAEDMPLGDREFDLVHTSAALHEMTAPQLQAILREVYRVLVPGGVFAIVDLHRPTNPLFWPGMAAFMGLFETETAWRFINEDLTAALTAAGFDPSDRTLYAGGSLQVIQARKPE